ncbi:MAG: type II toxin-antitoxin system HipA family toxin, partial [Muribaculaceae bacterium]|nr:type II toxin-antitoxin system HipA family toxin [Muribaculaceae bacterium]
MIAIDRCPSLLIEGHDTYSKNALKYLFDGREVSHMLGFSSPTSDNFTTYTSVKNAGRLSLSGAQSKFGLVLDTDSRLQYSPKDTQSTYILKPRPIGYHLMN